MQGTIGQNYAVNLFFGGISADISPELIDPKAGTVLDAHSFGISRVWKNVMRLIPGDKYLAVASAPSTTIVFIGGVWLSGKLVVLYRDTVADLTYIYANGVLIGQHADYPRQHCDIDTNDETSELGITDNVTVPIVLNLNEMIAAQAAGALTYFADYNFTLYSVNKSLQLNQPVFVGLDDLGAGGGLKTGSYAYSYALASKSGETTPWSPITPYIPVPESSVSLLANAAEGFASGLKTWGGQPSLDGSRYGIRLKFRVANMSGFDYIKIKRITNCTGQPVSYVPQAEFIILSTDAAGGVIDIKSDPYRVVEFVDSISKDWAVLDDSVTQMYSTVKRARTIRFYDRRIVLGGVEYESKILEDKEIFLTEPNVNRIAFPFLKSLDSGVNSGGFSNILNQVYMKSHRLGERYGYGIKLHDDQMNTLYSLPLKMTESKDDFTNFQFPERRTKMPVGTKRVDTIVLSGTTGTASILCNVVTRSIVFRSTLTATAVDFVSDNAAAYLASGVVLTSVGGSLIFMAAVAGVDFTGATSITPEGVGDLAGTVVTTQANVPPVRQEDLVLFAATPGYAFIGCTSTTGYMGRSLTYAGSDARLAAVAFVSAYTVDFATIGVTLSVYNNGGVKLTGPTNGSPITTTAEGSLILTTNAVKTVTAAQAARPRVDAVLFTPYTGAVGTVDVTCNGISRSVVYHLSWSNTLDEFVSAYAADYLPIVVSKNPVDSSQLLFTGSWIGDTTATTRTGGNLSGSVANTQANVIGDPQIDVVVFKTATGGSCTISCAVTGGGTHEVTRSGNTAVAIMSAFLTEENTSHGWAAIGVSIAYGGEGGGSIRFTGPSAKEVTVSASGTGYDHVTHVQDSSASTAQIDTITLTGISGNAIITCGGLARSITFDTSLTGTAIKFYTDYQAAYAAIGIAILNSGEGITFTALVAGVPFTTTIVNIADNATGNPSVYQTAASAVTQVDVVTLLGTSGTANITCQGITKIASFSVALDVTAINFCTNYAADYAVVGVTVGYNGGTIVFTGPAGGTTIITTASGTLVDNIYTSVPPAYGIAQIDKVTLTGASGNVSITCSGITRDVPFITNLSDTASRFVSWYAAAYLPEIEVTSVGADIFFTKLNALGVPFRGPTSAVNVTGTLNGAVEYTRANGAGGGEIGASTGHYQDSTIESWNGDSVEYVYDPVRARRLSKTSGSKELNIIDSGGKSYLPITPTGRGSMPNQNNYDDIVYNNIMNTVEAHSDNVAKYGRYVSTVGLRIGGIDVSKLPPSVKAFSVVRTPAAGRVVCQGVAMYALTEQGTNDPSLIKALNKVWFFSPEIDPVIGNKGGIYEDIKNNPGNYQMQLVAPCGFFTDVYSSYNNVNCTTQDIVSHMIHGAEDYARGMFAPDHDQSIGRSNYITFGRWRNTSDQGSGIDSSLTFSLNSAQDVPHAKIRAPYLELTLGTNLYNYAEVKNEACTTAQSKNFHEPWYIVNIIQNKQVPNNNVNSYNDIGHYIRLESVVGVSNGETTQVFPLVDERREDVYGLGETASTYRYIWVDGKPWLDTNNIAGANVTTYLATLGGAGKFTPTGGLECYGMYTLNSGNEITFNKVLSSGEAVVPEVGAKIVVKYNSNSPIEVFLGDTYIADATFLAVDVTGLQFRMAAPMPHYNFELKTTYHQAYNPLAANLWEDQGTHYLDYVRQWLINFTCESSMNLPMAYKNFFPNRNYVMRPKDYGAILTDETFTEFLKRLSIFPQYAEDYPNESHESWGYGGLYTPSVVNFDYEKSIPLKSYTEPQSGVNEHLVLMKRLHWTTQSIPGFESNRVFVPTNIYDLKNDKASQISILYDQFSDRGGNLYVITDRGAGLLLTDKQMITTAEGNSLSILTDEASFIKGEVWLNNAIGCPKEFWRGKVEGNVKLPNNIVSEVLAFLSQDDVILFSNNSFVKLADNNRRAIMASLEAVDLTADFDTKLYSVISDNKLQINIGSKLYSFNFDINNWDGGVLQLSYDKIFDTPYLSGYTHRNKVVGAFHNSTQLGLTVSQESSDRVSIFSTMPYITFSVTPEVGRDVDFTDMYLTMSYAPYSVQVSLDQDFADSAVIPVASMSAVAGGIYHIHGLPRRSLSGRKLIGRTLFVKVIFPDNLQLYDLKTVKTGYKFISGS